MRKNLSLFVWDESSEPYSGGCLWAIAASVEEARKMLADRIGASVLPNDPKIFPLNKEACGGHFYFE